MSTDMPPNVEGFEDDLEAESRERVSRQIADFARRRAEAEEARRVLNERRNAGLRRRHAEKLKRIFRNRIPRRDLAEALVRRLEAVEDQRDAQRAEDARRLQIRLHEMEDAFQRLTGGEKA